MKQGDPLPHHFKRGGGHSGGVSLDFVGGRRRGRAGRVGKGGATKCRIFLRG